MGERAEITPEQLREAVEAMARAMWERDIHGPQITWDEFLSLPINVHRTDIASSVRAKAAAALDALLALGWRAPVREGGEIE